MNTQTYLVEATSPVFGVYRLTVTLPAGQPGYAVIDAAKQNLALQIGPAAFDCHFELAAGL